MSYSNLYLKQRFFIGVCGILLPFLCVAGTFIDKKTSMWQPSISHYYYTTSHVIFLGVLCFLGTVLLFYTGKESAEGGALRKTLVARTEYWISNIAAFCAFGVAAFPTAQAGLKSKAAYSFISMTLDQPLLGRVNMLHYLCACLLFLCFAVFCFFLFTKSDRDDRINKKYPTVVRRKIFYKGCGWFIIAGIAGIGVSAIVENAFGIEFTVEYNITFWCEVFALVAFGLSWLVKCIELFENTWLKPVVRYIYGGEEELKPEFKQQKH